MTVHGAKGLEADVVFLIDTGGQIVVNQHRECLVDIGDAQGPAFLWRRKSDEAPEPQLRADRIADDETQKEYLRLLYVAMTRARDVLYVGGIRPNRKEVEGCWYARVRDALVPADAERNPETGELAAACVWPQPERQPNPPAAERARDGRDPGALSIPGWLFEPAPSPPPAPRPLRPSRGLAEPDPLAEPAQQPAPNPHTRSPSQRPPHNRTRGQGSMRRCAAMLSTRFCKLARHRLRRPPAAASACCKLIPADPAERSLSRRSGSRLVPPRAGRGSSGPTAAPRCPIVGRVRLRRRREEYAVSGQIDRLVRTASGWQVVDFKTNRAVPGSLDDADPGLRAAARSYRKLLIDMDPAPKSRRPSSGRPDRNLCPSRPPGWNRLWPSWLARQPRSLTPTRASAYLLPNDPIRRPTMATSPVTDATFRKMSSAPGAGRRRFLGGVVRPCKMIGPHLEEISTELSGKVKIVKLNIDENQQTAIKYGVAHPDADHVQERRAGRHEGRRRARRATCSADPERRR
jgi:hypothetical protein